MDEVIPANTERIEKIMKKNANNYSLSDVAAIARHNARIARAKARDVENAYKSGECSSYDYIALKHICDTLAERWERVITVIDAE